MSKRLNTVRPLADGSGDASAQAGETCLRRNVSRTLVWGMSASASLIILGWILAAIQGTTGYPPGEYPRSADAIARGLASLKPGAVQAFGFLLLIGTPLARVAVSSAMYFRMRERALGWMSVAVLLVLAGGLLLGQLAE
ncbi:MAG: DUF1634 domain-containing protein [Firmicutes bacterium]|nr:DUF1634 domain-containing protein [Bacillota bacterium]